MAPVMTNSIIEDMKDKEWLKTTAEKEAEYRLAFLKSFIKGLPHYCPECRNPLETDDEQIYCPNCGLICMDSTKYTAGMKYEPPHGLKLG